MSVYDELCTSYEIKLVVRNSYRLDFFILTAGKSGTFSVDPKGAMHYFKLYENYLLSLQEFEIVDGIPKFKFKITKGAAMMLSDVTFLEPEDAKSTAV